MWEKSLWRNLHFNFIPWSISKMHSSPKKIWWWSGRVLCKAKLVRETKMWDVKQSNKNVDKNCQRSQTPDAHCALNYRQTWKLREVSLKLELGTFLEKKNLWSSLFISNKWVAPLQRLYTTTPARKAPEAPTQPSFASKNFLNSLSQLFFLSLKHFPSN